MIDRRRACRRRARRGVALALVVVLALVGAACGGNRSTAKPATTSSGHDRAAAAATASIIDTSTCPADTDTTGVSGDTITIGTSLPQSGTYAPFAAILNGEQAYFDYIERQRRRRRSRARSTRSSWSPRTTRTIASQTVTNVQSLLNDDNVFALFNVVGTKNNLAIRDIGEHRVRARPVRRERRDAVGQPRSTRG